MLKTVSSLLLRLNQQEVLIKVANFYDHRAIDTSDITLR